MSHTILHADDHPLARMGIQSAIRALPDYRIIPEDIEDGDRAIIMIDKYHPDIVLLDLDMPKTNGFKVAQYIREKHPAILMVLLSALIDVTIYREGLALGVKGFLLKTAPPSEIEECLDTIVTGNKFLSQDIAKQLGGEMLKANLNMNEFDVLLQNLTEREKIVLRLIMEGMTSLQIADKLHNSIKTIETHRSNITHKLDIHGRERLSSYVTKHKASLEKAMVRTLNNNIKSMI